MAREYPLLIGASGWSHPVWQTEFYPDGLPAEWRLGYYANEFPVVLVTAREWALHEADAAHWCEDTDPSFRFVVEIIAQTAAAIQLELDRIATLGERCIGVILCCDARTEVAALEAMLDVIGNSWPVCLEFGTDHPAEDLRRVLAERDTGWCWHGVGSAEGLKLGNLAVTRIRSQQDNPRQIRQWVETALASSTDQRNSLLIFEGEPPDIAGMRQAQIILDLL